MNETDKQILLLGLLAICGEGRRCMKSRKRFCLGKNHTSYLDHFYSVEPEVMKYRVFCMISKESVGQSPTSPKPLH
jgi:hypothetical protein